MILTVFLLSACACEHQWQAATCVEPETCALCGETQGEPLGHDWMDATCIDPEICTRCGETQGEALGHDWVDATCIDPEICTRCGETQGEALGHDWQEATCVNPETCSRCGETQGEALGHDWQEATCTDPEICSRCGETQGKALDHDWSKATCTSAGTCERCGATTGEALGHKYQEATCILPKTCSRCGKTSGRANGHSFPEESEGEEKVCTICGRSVTTKYVALTFDDGPSGDLTLKLLEGLEKRNVRSTFFICGYRMPYYPGLPQIVLDHGHELALHTYNHPNLTTLSSDEIREELQSTLDLMPEGANVRLMRPPGGNYNKKVRTVCEEMGLAIILWSLDTRDWTTNDVDAIVNKLVNNVKDGDVILMHELKKSSIEAALKAIDILQGQGYEFVTVSELAAIQGETLEAGKVYTKP